MNILEFLKNGSGIHIKEKNKGSFTRWCGGNVTEECIRKGKASSNPKIRKKATFADNARRWKHESGGILRFLLEGGKNSAPSNKFLSKGWFKLAGLTINGIANNVGDFFGTDLGKGLLDVGKGAFEGFTNYKNASKLLGTQVAENKASLKLSYQNSILQAEFNRKLALLQYALQWKNAIANGETTDNFSEIVSNHAGWEEYSNNFSLAISLLRQLQALLDLQAKNAKGSLLGNLFGSVVLNGLGALGNILSSTTNSSTNSPSKINSSKQNNFWTNPNLGQTAGAIPDYTYLLK